MLSLVAVALSASNVAFFSNSVTKEDEMIERRDEAREAVFDSHMMMRIKHTLQEHEQPMTMGQCAAHSHDDDDRSKWCGNSGLDDHKLDVTLYGNSFLSPSFL